MISSIIQYVITSILGIIIGALAAVLRSKIKKIETEKSKNEALYDGVKALLHDRIYSIGERATVENCITNDDFENLTELYLPYEKLGGNGTGHELYNKCKTLKRVRGIREIVK